jgi:hypothetical protein
MNQVSFIRNHRHCEAIGKIIQSTLDVVPLVDPATGIDIKILAVVFPKSVAVGLVVAAHHFAPAFQRNGAHHPLPWPEEGPGPTRVLATTCVKHFETVLKKNVS